MSQNLGPSHYLELSWFHLLIKRLVSMTKVDCSRCAGTGKVVHMHVKSGVCFKCKGRGKVTKMKRVRVIDNWFSVDQPALNYSTTVGTIEEAQEIADELDAQLFEGEGRTQITPRSSYHFELQPE